jgi:hypothetical protein
MFLCRFSRKNIVLRILIPFPILNKSPSLFNYGVKIVKSLNPSFFNSQDRRNVVLHVRKGYDEKYADLEYVKNRSLYLPYRNYSEILSALAKRATTSKRETIIVHTDLVQNTQKWRPSQSSIIERYRERAGKGSIEHIELPGVDLSKEVTFPCEFDFQIFYCDDFFKTFKDMCNAETLIMSKSAFSYLAGLLNDYSIIWPVSHNHSKLKHWIDSESMGVKCT